jgi:hypothetical protein
LAGKKTAGLKAEAVKPSEAKQFRQAQPSQIGPERPLVLAANKSSGQVGTAAYAAIEGVKIVLIQQKSTKLERKQAIIGILPIIFCLLPFSATTEAKVKDTRQRGDFQQVGWS